MIFYANFIFTYGDRTQAVVVRSLVASKPSHLHTGLIQKF